MPGATALVAALTPARCLADTAYDSDTFRAWLWRRVATRYDKLAQNYRATVTLAAILLYWL